MSVISFKWRMWGRAFGVEGRSDGRWSAVGRARGKGAYPLTLLGDEATEEAMQHRLDAWGRKNGARMVLPRDSGKQRVMAL